eukprot:scaffold20179_cov184-Skeletonema_marinoi.AAC.1
MIRWLNQLHADAEGHGDVHVLSSFCCPRAPVHSRVVVMITAGRINHFEFEYYGHKLDMSNKCLSRAKDSSILSWPTIMGHYKLWIATFTA